MTRATRDALQLRPATNDDGPAIRDLVFGILPEFGLSPAPTTTDKDLYDIEAFYAGGFFDVLVEAPDERIIATVGVSRVTGDVGELRKMYLAADRRGGGRGRVLLDHALDRSRAMGFKRIELETAAVLRAAVNMYEAYGFRRFEKPDCASRCDIAMYIDL